MSGNDFQNTRKYISLMKNVFNWHKTEPCSRVAWHRPSIRGKQIIRFARMTETELRLKLQRDSA